jgi:tetratricopeptide (TPR) repeat protein
MRTWWALAVSAFVATSSTVACQRPNGTAGRADSEIGVGFASGSGTPSAGARASRGLGAGSASASFHDRVGSSARPLSASSIPPSTLAVEPATSDSVHARPLQRCFADQPAWLDAPVSDLLDHAAALFDEDDFAGALACAEEAARQAPRSVEAHHDRAAALVRLGRTDEARDALTLALALAPDDPETLEASADLFINQLPPSSDRASIGLEQARRGFRRIVGRDARRAARLALLEGQALIDLGRAEDALRRLDASLALNPRLSIAQYEKGVALFELCRFGEAKRWFEKVLGSDPDHVHALYHVALIEERMGDPQQAEAWLAEASRRDPQAFPSSPEVSQNDFAARVQRVVAALPEDVRIDLAAANVETADLPAMEDLVAEKPPLSPTILGLFRGLPIGWTAENEGSVTTTPITAKGRTDQTAPGARTRRQPDVSNGSVARGRRFRGPSGLCAGVICRSELPAVRTDDRALPAQSSPLDPRCLGARSGHRAHPAPRGRSPAR